MGFDGRATAMLTIPIYLSHLLTLQDIFMKSEKYLEMLNDGEEYLEIVSVGVSPPSKPMHYFKTVMKV